MRQSARLERAISLADQLIQVTGGLDSPDVHAMAERLRYTLRPAMDIRDILALVPGETVAARARNIGVSRWTYYLWLDGRVRPNEERAARLAELTGIPEHVILAR